MLTLSLVIGVVVTERLMGGISLEGGSAQAFLQLMVGAVVLAFVNSTLGGLLKLATVPLRCMTLGLFTLVINGAMLMLVGQFGLGFQVDSFLSAVVASILISIANALLPTDPKKKGKRDD